MNHKHNKRFPFAKTPKLPLVGAPFRLYFFEKFFKLKTRNSIEKMLSAATSTRAAYGLLLLQLGSRIEKVRDRLITETVLDHSDLVEFLEIGDLRNYAKQLNHQEIVAAVNYLNSALGILEQNLNAYTIACEEIKMYETASAMFPNRE